MSLTCHLLSFASQDADVPGKALSRGQRISPRRATHLHVPAPQRARQDRQPGAVRRPRAGRNARPLPRPPTFSVRRRQGPVPPPWLSSAQAPWLTASPTRRPLAQCAGAAALVGVIWGLGSASRTKSGPCDLNCVEPKPWRLDPMPIPTAASRALRPPSDHNFYPLEHLSRLFFFSSA